MIAIVGRKKLPSGHQSVRAPWREDVSPYFSVDLPGLGGHAHRLVTARKNCNATFEG
jgi:hypothetical protein